MWKTTASKIVHETKWIKLREDKITVPTGDQLTYTYLDQAGAVFIVPITNAGNIVLIRNYRHTVKEWCWEIPSGTRADVVGMPVDEVAFKELQEEIGATQAELVHLGDLFLSNGMANCKGTFYLANAVEFSGDTDLEIGEEISDIKEFTLEQVEEMVLRGEISDGDSCLALLLAFKHLEKIKVK